MSPNSAGRDGGRALRLLLVAQGSERVLDGRDALVGFRSVGDLVGGIVRSACESEYVSIRTSISSVLSSMVEEDSVAEVSRTADVEEDSVADISRTADDKGRSTFLLSTGSAGVMACAGRGM